MKKKILLTLLVVFLIGVLVVGVVACNNNNSNKKPSSNKNNKTEEKTEFTDEDWTNVIVEVGNGLDSAAASVRDMKDGEGHAKATLYVNVDTGEEGDEPTNLEISVEASISENTDAKNWANITVSAIDDGTSEDLFGLAVREEILYIGQPYETGKFKWVKLSQFEDAGLIIDKLVPTFVGAISDYVAGNTTDENGEETTYAAIVKAYKNAMSAFKDEKSEEYIAAKALYDAAVSSQKSQQNFKNGTYFTKGEIAGLGVYNLAKTILPGVAGDLFSMVGDAKTPVTDNGYSFNLNVSGLSSLLQSLSSMLSGVKIPAEYEDLINQVANILLGAKIKFNHVTVEDEETGDEVEKLTIAGIEVATDKSEIPTIQIDLGIDKNKALTGLGLSYTKGTLNVAFGIKDFAIEAKAATAKDIDDAEELAIKLSATLNVPNVTNGNLNVDVVVQPNVKLSFWDEDDKDAKFTVDGTEYNRAGYVNIDFSGLYGYATVNGTVFATYNDTDKGFLLDLSKVIEALSNVSVTADTKYYIPLDAQATFDNRIKDMVIANASADNDAAQNAVSKDVKKSDNLVDQVVTIVDSFFGDEGFSFNIGSVGTIIGMVLDKSDDGIMAYVDKVIAAVYDDSDDDKDVFTLDAGDLMNEKGGLIYKLLSGSKYLQTKEVAGVYEGDTKVQKTLLDILAKDKLLDTLVGFINASVYEKHANADETITTFASRIAGNTIANNGYVWTTKEDVKALAGMVGMTSDAVDALYADIYTGTKAVLTIEKTTGELKITVGGVTASLKLGVATTDNVVYTKDNHKLTKEGALDTSVEGNVTKLLNVAIQAANSKLPSKYKLKAAE